MQKTRIGVIGTGGISSLHLNAYKAHPQAEIAALCDLSTDLLARRGREYGVAPAHLYADYHEMLAREDLDAVSVCTWNSQHAPCTLAALASGAHVLCEKPMAMSAEQARAMQAAALTAGKLLMIGFVRRFSSDYEILKDFIDRGDFGELYHAKAVYLRRKGCPGGWFGEKARAGGGPLIDLGVHVIDLTRYLMGNPKPVSVYGATFRKLGARENIKSKPAYVAASATAHDICDVEDFCTAMIRYDNGAVVNLDASFALNLKKNVSRIELFGTQAGAKLEPELEIYSEWNGHMTDVTLTPQLPLSMDEMFAKEIDHFLRCIREGIPCRNTAEDGIELMRILDAIYQSAETGHEVILASSPSAADA
ncbi:MAG: Gfo/Idh/MocA family oxidoreductase [Oscillospiraceae bacterium]|jgi:predicted dehydrogenase|nr:Gfo/Idh/MocA family oxidoreductase [Oscillospiraceae bacterium]